MYLLLDGARISVIIHYAGRDPHETEDFGWFFFYALLGKHIYEIGFKHVGNKLEFGGELVTLRCKKTPDARNVREGGKRQKLHRMPQGEGTTPGGRMPPRVAVLRGYGVSKGD